METKLPVVSIQRHRINSDGQGVRTLIHSYGCNMQCLWCCNPQTRFLEQYNNMTVQELFESVKLDDIYFLATKGGITFSGGEPLLHSKFITEFSELAHSMTWTIAVESAFNIDRNIIDETFDSIDEYKIDIKSMSSDTHKKYTGVTNEKILSNIEYLSKKVDNFNNQNKIQKSITISTPIIPTINDDVENIKQTIDFLKSNNIKTYRLLNYRDYSEDKYTRMGLNYPLSIEYDKEGYTKNLENLRKLVEEFLE
jgi:pyruvate formate lyase activating enzyme